jgi:hypothetical protein
MCCSVDRRQSPLTSGVLYMFTQGDPGHVGLLHFGFDAVQREKEKEFLGERRWPS